MHYTDKPLVSADLEYARFLRLKIKSTPLKYRG